MTSYALAREADRRWHAARRAWRRDRTPLTLAALREAHERAREAWSAVAATVADDVRANRA